jgi:choline dehydrogenase
VPDGDLRLHKAKNLRIVEASALPQISGIFIILSKYMISEKAAAVIIAEARNTTTGSWNRLPSLAPAANSPARGGTL